MILFINQFFKNRPSASTPHSLPFNFTTEKKTEKKDGNFGSDKQWGTPFTDERDSTTTQLGIAQTTAKVEEQIKALKNAKTELDKRNQASECVKSAKTYLDNVQTNAEDMVRSMYIIIPI